MTTLRRIFIWIWLHIIIIAVFCLWPYQFWGIFFIFRLFPLGVATADHPFPGIISRILRNIVIIRKQKLQFITNISPSWRFAYPRTQGYSFSQGARLFFKSHARDRGKRLINLAAAIRFRVLMHGDGQVNGSYYRFKATEIEDEALTDLHSLQTVWVLLIRLSL